MSANFTAAKGDREARALACEFGKDVTDSVDHAKQRVLYFNGRASLHNDIYICMVDVLLSINWIRCAQKERVYALRRVRDLNETLDE